MTNAQKNITVKIDRRHIEMVKQMSEKRELTQKACLEKVIEEANRIMKQKTKLRAKLKIEELTPDEAVVFLERKVEGLEKNISYLIGIAKLQEREILNPIFSELKRISSQNEEIIEGLKAVK